MATDNEVLFVVTKLRLFNDDRSATWASQMWLFRTRAAARAFAVAKRERSKLYAYTVSPAKWGPAS